MDSETSPRGQVYDKEEVHRMYLSSQYLEFAEFARSQGWNATASQNYPVRSWVQEKRRILARREGETLAQTIFEHKGAWHTQVLKTLRDYPALVDNMAMILIAKQNHYIEMIKRDKEVRNARDREISKVKAGDLFALTSAIKMCTEAKHKSLMMDDWSVQIAERLASSRAAEEQDQNTIEVNPEEPWALTLKCGETMTKKDLQEAVMQWYDPPVLKPTEGQDGGSNS